MAIHPIGIDDHPPRTTIQLDHCIYVVALNMVKKKKNAYFWCWNLTNSVDPSYRSWAVAAARLGRDAALGFGASSGCGQVMFAPTFSGRKSFPLHGNHGKANGHPQLGLKKMEFKHWSLGCFCYHLGVKFDDLRLGLPKFAIISVNHDTCHVMGIPEKTTKKDGGFLQKNVWFEKSWNVRHIQYKA